MCEMLSAENVVSITFRDDRLQILLRIYVSIGVALISDLSATFGLNFRTLISLANCSLQITIGQKGFSLAIRVKKITRTQFII